VFQDPVILTCGHTFEHAAIIGAHANQRLCPICRVNVDPIYTPNYLIRALVEAHGVQSKFANFSHNIMLIKVSLPDDPPAAPAVVEDNKIQIEVVNGMEFIIIDDDDDDTYHDDAYYGDGTDVEVVGQI